MKRTAQVEGNALDMLLDAMTNAFGGIIFIGLVVVFMSRNTPQKQTDDDRTDASREKHRIEMLIIDTRRKLQASRMRMQHHRGILDRHDSHPNVSLVDEQLTTAGKLEVAEARTRKLSAALRSQALLADETEAQAGKAVTDNDRLRSEEAKIHRECQEMRADSRAKQARLQELAKSTRSGKLRFARLRAASKTPFFLILDGGRLFRINEANSPFQGTTSTDVERTPIDRANSLVRPRQGRGTAVRGMPLKSFFASCADASRFYLDFSVATDSFGEWIVLKDWLREHDYSYNWMPLDDTGGIVFRSGGDARHESYR